MEFHVAVVLFPGWLHMKPKEPPQLLCIGVLFGCFGGKIDGPGLPGGLIIYQGHLFPLKGHLCVYVFPHFSTYSFARRVLLRGKLPLARVGVRLLIAFGPLQRVQPLREDFA